MDASLDAKLSGHQIGVLLMWNDNKTDCLQPSGCNVSLIFSRTVIIMNLVDL